LLAAVAGWEGCRRLLPAAGGGCWLLAAAVGCCWLLLLAAGDAIGDACGVGTWLDDTTGHQSDDKGNNSRLGDAVWW